MNPTKQTILHDPDNGKHGNCFSAVLASLLHLDIAEIPTFASPDWVRECNAWLRQFGLAYLVCEPGLAEILERDGIAGMWHEIAGPSYRHSDVLHAVVAHDSKAVFDPHPDDCGLTDVRYIGVFFALEPWRMVRPANDNAPAAEKPPAIPPADGDSPAASGP